MADEVLENLKMWTADPLCVAAAKRIEADGAEIERLRAAVLEAYCARGAYRKEVCDECSCTAGKVLTGEQKLDQT